MYPHGGSSLFIPLGSSVWRLSIRNASRALRMESRDVRWDKLYVVRCVVIAGEMFRNSCLS